MSLNYKVVTISVDPANPPVDLEVLVNTKRIFYIQGTGLAYIRLQDGTKDQIPLKHGDGLILPEQVTRIYFTPDNLTGVSGNVTYVFLCSNSDMFDWSGEGITEPAIPVQLSPQCAAGATEYSQALSVPTGLIKKIQFKARGGDIQLSFTKGDSGINYELIGDGAAQTFDGIAMNNTTVYFQSPTPGAVLEIFLWY